MTDDDAGTGGGLIGYYAAAAAGGGCSCHHATPPPPPSPSVLLLLRRSRRSLLPRRTRRCSLRPSLLCCARWCTVVRAPISRCRRRRLRGGRLSGRTRRRPRRPLRRARCCRGRGPARVGAPKEPEEGPNHATLGAFLRRRLGRSPGGGRRGRRRLLRSRAGGRTLRHGRSRKSETRIRQRGGGRVQRVRGHLLRVSQRLLRGAHPRRPAARAGGAAVSACGRCHGRM